MSTGWKCVALVALALTCAVAAGDESGVQVSQLRCEYRDDPLGIDTLRPRLSWILESAERGQRQTAYQVLVAGSRDALNADRGDLWDTGRVDSDRTVHVVYDGKPLASGMRCWWKVRVWDRDGRASAYSRPAWWQVGLLEQSDWSARWIGRPEQAVSDDQDTRPGSTLLRKRFELPDEVKRATASVVGLGWYELYLNGAKVGDHVLAPPNSRYGRRVLFDTFDVTEQLRQGANAVGIQLGAGYDAEYSRWGWKFLGSQRVIAQIDVELADGRQVRIATDGSWRMAPGPITSCGIYSGETYDARRERDGWSTPEFDDADFTPVALLEGPGGALRPNTMPPMRVVETIRPVEVSEPKPGVFVFDMGQNFAGWVRLRVEGPRGTKVVIRHSELLGDDGMIDPWTNRNAEATDTYILRGEGVETHEPRFTYHGFRYVELTGYPGRPTADDVTGCAVHAEVGSAGQWTCSDPLLNRIQQNFLRGMRSNLMGIPTDCPMRDERTPCAMDSHVFEETAIYNFHMNAYYVKWARDIRGEPMLPDWPGDGEHPDWSADRVLLPWRLWWYYADRRALQENYQSMKDYVDSVHARTPEHIYKMRFGDWCAPNPGKSWEDFFHDVEVVNTALYYRITRLLSRSAAVLGKSDDAARYGRLADAIRDAFNRELRSADEVTYGDGSQTTSLLPLTFGMVPAGKVDAVFDGLVERILTTDKGHLDTGITGTRYLFDVLADHGRPDVAMTILSQRTYPSYGHQIDQGATTTWEQWSFRGPMNSHNHAMFAGPGVSFYSRFAGIRPAAPGFKRIVVRPVVPPGLDEVEAAVETVHGRIASRWSQDPGQRRLQLDVTIPVNTTAEVHVPCDDAGSVIEGGRPVDEVDSVRLVRVEDGSAVFEVGSGDYEFVSRWAWKAER